MTDQKNTYKLTYKIIARTKPHSAGTPHDIPALALGYLGERHAWSMSGGSRLLTPNEAKVFETFEDAVTELNFFREGEKNCNYWVGDFKIICVDNTGYEFFYDTGNPVNPVEPVSEPEPAKDKYIICYGEGKRMTVLTSITSSQCGSLNLYFSEDYKFASVLNYDTASQVMDLVRSFTDSDKYGCIPVSPQMEQIFTRITMG